MKTTDLFNKAFERDDMQLFTTLKNDQRNIFDIVVGKFKASDGTRHDIHYTNDPIKMLGCGYRIVSSYSPQSESFKYLPSFVLQDYIGMLYVADEHLYYIDRNDIRLAAPNYLVRAFVMIDPESRRILYKMPMYTDEHTKFATVFDSIKEEGFGFLRSETVAPEIHLDVLDLYKPKDAKGNKMYPKAHIAICGRQYPSREAQDAYYLKMNWYKSFGKKKDDK